MLAGKSLRPFVDLHSKGATSDFFQGWSAGRRSAAGVELENFGMGMTEIARSEGAFSNLGMKRGRCCTKRSFGGFCYGLPAGSVAAACVANGGRRICGRVMTMVCRSQAACMHGRSGQRFRERENASEEREEQQRYGDQPAHCFVKPVSNWRLHKHRIRLIRSATRRCPSQFIYVRDGGTDLAEHVFRSIACD